MSPRQAIIVYSDKRGNEYYLESREFSSQGGKSVLMAPVPLAEDTFRDIAKSYIKSTGDALEFADVIPDHILYAVSRPGHTVVVWYRPAMVRKLNFSGRLNIKGESAVKVPATLYMVHNKSLYLFALMNDSRPDAWTKLYGAPFFNIYSDGRVCLGTAQVGNRSRTFDGEAERFERAFYMAEQNGGITDHCKTPLNKLWTTLIKSNADFPSSKELKQHPKHKTLRALMSAVAGKPF